MKTQKTNLCAILIVLMGVTVWAETLTSRQEMLCSQDNIRDLMKRVVRFQTDAFGGTIKTDWKVGTFYTGVYAAYEATGDQAFHDAAKAWCEKADWKLSGKSFHADNICTAQTYLDMYMKHKQDAMIADTRAKLQQYFGKTVLKRSDIGHATWKGQQTEFNGRNLWWWCDALYMAPPVMTRMYAATGDRRYLDLMHELYWDTTDYLFNEKEGLYFRDCNYFKPKTPAGKPVFWGRGNGWVYGGLMRLLPYIPDEDPQKQKYIDLFRTMTRSLVKYQQPDGLWRSSLNEPDWWPMPESSGSSFFCYGLLAGINNGYLDKQTYLPVALKAWEGLLGCVNTQGRLGCAQLVGQNPQPSREHDFIDYTHGAFLLAASELYKMNLTAETLRKAQPPYEVRLLARDGAWTWFNDERAIIDDNALYIGSLDSTGTARVDTVMLKETYSEYAYQEFPLSSWKSKDDHNNPALLKMSSGKILACYSQHSRQNQWNCRIAEPKGRSHYFYLKWSPEQTVKTPAASSYCNLVQLAGENNRIYNFSRNVNYNPNVQISDDMGQTWSEPFLLIKTGTGRTRPYVKYADNGKDRIDFLYTDGHPRDEAANNVYHLYYQKGSFYKSDGTLIKTMAQAKTDPMTPADGTVIYNGTTEGRGWVWDLEYDKDGSPVAAFINSADHEVGKDLRYRLARFDPKTKKWTRRQIAFAGTHLYEAEKHYAGGITIDPANPDIVFISTDVDPVTGKPNASGRCQIFRGQTPDAGQTWKWKQLTFDAAVDNLRPFVPRGHKQGICVLWCRGQYKTFTDHKTSIVGIIEK